MDTVSINNLTLCHKHSSGWVKSTMFDVCKSPANPVPYTNTAYAKDLEDGTTTVLSNGDAMCGIKGSRFFPSYDDEKGTGGGVLSLVNMHQATWLSWSPDVFFEGRPVTRLTDKMLMNKGNTVSIGGYYTGQVQGKDRLLLHALCDIACECKGKGNQACVQALINLLPKTKTDGLYPEVSFAPDGTMYTNPDGTPQTRMGVPGSRLDVTELTAGSPSAIVEMKFKGDRWRPGQRAKYQALSAKLGVPLLDLDVEEECECNNKKRRPIQQPNVHPVPAQDQKKSGVNWWGVAGGVAVGAAIACVIIEPCGAAVAAGAAAVGTAAGGLLGAAPAAAPVLAPALAL